MTSIPKLSRLQRVALLILVLTLLLPLATVSAEEAPLQAGVSARTHVNLRLRSGPGTSYPVVGTVPRGVTVPVVGRNAAGNWLQVQYNGQSGWIAAWYATVNGALASVPVGDGNVVQAAAPAAAAPPSDAAQVYALINQTRCQNGLHPLAPNPQLEAAAAAHAQDMATHNFFSHTGSNGSSVLDRVLAQGYALTYIGENLAAGNSTADATVQQWLNSPGHRDNMLNAAFTEVGLAHVAQAGTTYGHYWSLVLGNRAGATPPTCAQLGY
ncbi:MAG TPA: CAP domain-containing protein [Aggregatilineales bacterium]|nr:SH3 domain-containing protein [Chloroflexota bacterium]HOA24092.1 CAP domain-containing protein [Aggregatilineales bacterium]HPV07574.1 CAP domain-containing protein [Aggregatilineales bacterium]HQA68522.1 CAP domain-containing protein [Aggregatilineales bacterium]HQE19368.1 CAP domain-containing protein [Aggregatilineales bacterium]